MAPGRAPTTAQEKVTTIFDRTRDHAIVDETATLDEQTLTALGYKQQFKRDFSILESFSVSFAVLGLLPSIASTISYSLGYSGTGGAVWGWLIAGLMIQSVAFSMAELCSSMPTAGGLYYATACLAPAGWGPICSWFVGWSNFAGFVPCSLDYALAYMITTAATISNPDYTPKDWHIYLIFLAILTLNGLVAMQSTKFIGWTNIVGTVFNVIMVIVFVIWFPVGSKNHPKTNNTHDVWTTFENGTEWPIGWAMIMGFLTSLYTLAGYDSPFHLTEECSNSAIASPRAIVMTAQSGLYLGWAIILVIVYTVKDIQDVVAGPYGQPWGSLCVQVLGKEQGLALFGLTMVAQFFCGLGTTITSSRIIFAYSRDGAVPGSRIWSTVDKRFKTPVYATWGVLFIAALVGLLLFAGPVAINAVFTIVAIGQYTSFTTPIALKLFFNNGRFKPGPWHLGKFSKPLNAIASTSGAKYALVPLQIVILTSSQACSWWLLIVPALCFPSYKGSDLTLQTMNWTCLIYGGVMLIAMVWYAVDARKWFKGPRINVEHLDTITPDDSQALHEAKEQ